MIQTDTALIYISPVLIKSTGVVIWVRLAVVTSRPDNSWPVYFEYSLN